MVDNRTTIHCQSSNFNNKNKTYNNNNNKNKTYNNNNKKHTTTTTTTKTRK
jgi:hypothetical protein